MKLHRTASGAVAEHEGLFFRLHDDWDALLRSRGPHPALAPHPALPDDTRLWAALQRASGGPWAGCVYDVDRIVAALAAGQAATSETRLAPAVAS